MSTSQPSQPVAPPQRHLDVTRADAVSGPESDHSAAATQAPIEIGGRNGPEPTRFGDWEKAGRCIDF